MKKRLIKALSIILTVMMLVGVVPVGAMTAFAADVKEAAPEVRDKIVTLASGVAGNYEYEVLGDGTAKITRYTGSASSIYIPSSLGGYTVTSIGYGAFRDCKSITSVVFMGNVKTLDAEVFTGCEKLKSISIPNSVTQIGSYAFSYCSSLTSVNIPNTLTEIGFHTFDRCTSLASITIPSSVKIIGTGAFTGCSGLTDITIPSSVTEVGHSSFENCSSLTSVTIPDSVTIVDAFAFYGCTNLAKVKLGSGLKTIGSQAFGNTNITEITVPKSVTEMSGFYSAKNLKKVIFEYGMTEIPSYALYDCESVEEVIIPNTVKTIHNEAFDGCIALKSISIPNSVTEIESYAFKGCTGLISVKLPSGITTVDFRVFENCTGLVSVTIPDSVTTIGSGAFAGCTGLTDIKLPNNVTKISSSAFYYCTGLKSILIPKTVTSIGSSAFYNCASLTDVYYTGSEAQWKLITIDGYNEPLLNATIHYNYYVIPDDGKLTLSDNCVILNVGEKYQLKAFVDGHAVSDNVTWFATGNDGFTVSADGVITATSEGYGYMSAFYKDNVMDFVECFVYVGKPNEFNSDVNLDPGQYYSEYGFSCGNYSRVDSVMFSVAVENKIDDILTINDKIDMDNLDDSFTDIYPITLTLTVDGNDLSFKRDSYQNKYVTTFDTLKPGEEQIIDAVKLFPYNFSLSPDGNKYTVTAKYESKSFATITEKYTFTVEKKAVISDDAYVFSHNIFSQRTLMPEKYSFSNKAWAVVNGMHLLGFKAWDAVEDVLSFNIDFEGSKIEANCYELYLTDLILKYSGFTDGGMLEAKSYAIYDHQREYMKKVLMTSEEWNKCVANNKTIESEIDSYLVSSDYKLSAEASIAMNAVAVDLFANNGTRFKEGCKAMKELFTGFDIVDLYCDYVIGSSDPVGAFQKADEAYVIAKLYRDVSDEYFRVLYDAANNMENKKQAELFRNAIDDFYDISKDEKTAYNKALILLEEDKSEIMDPQVDDCVQNLVIGTVAQFFGIAESVVSVILVGAKFTYGFLNLALRMEEKSNLYYLMYYIAPIEAALCKVENKYAMSLQKDASVHSARLYDAAYSILRCTNMYLYECAYNYASMQLSNRVHNEKILRTAGYSKKMWKDNPCHGKRQDLVTNKYVSVQCPVDVNVYDADGKLLVSVVNEEIKACDDSVTLLVSNGKKSMVYPADKDYRIEIIPRSSGTMNYYVSEINDGKTTRSLDFYDVPITESAKYTADIPQELDVDSSEYALTMGDKTVDCNYDSTVATCADDNHKFGVWTVEEKSGICKEGVKSHVCSVCGKKVYEPVSASHLHTEVKGAYEPTCTEEGYKGNTMCSDCGDFVSEGERIPATGHSIGDWEIVKEPTEAETGLKQRKCTVCGKVIEEAVIPSLGGFIDSGNCGESAKWTLYKDGTLVISGTGAMTDYLYYSMNTPWINYCSQITNVVIENGITSIGEKSFFNCTNLTSVTIPNSVTSIGYYAFGSCESLTNITIPNSVTSIGVNAFYNCSGLANIVIPNSVTQIGSYAFGGCTSLTSVIIPNSITVIDDCVFADCTGLKSVTIPNSVTVIEGAAFFGCSKLTNVVIPDSVLKMHDKVFAYCTGLTSVTLSKNLTEMWFSTFEGCTSLNNITIPDGLTEISDWTFKDCTNLTGITIPISVTRISPRAFVSCDALADVYYGGTKEQWDKIDIRSYNDNLLNANIHFNEITEDDIIDSGFCGENSMWKLVDTGTLIISGTGIVKHYTRKYTAPWFKYTDQIKYVFIEEGITRIGEFAFYGCKNLESVTIANSVKEISGYVFKNCVNLKEITLPKNLEKIGDSAFYGTGLAKIKIPATVKSVGYYAFSRCYSLKNIEFLGNAPVFYSNAFNKVVATVNYPANNSTWTAAKKQQYGGTIKWLEAGLIDEGYCGSTTTWKLSADGTLTISGTGIVKNYSSPSIVPWNKYASQIKKIVVEEGVTRIGEFAFYGCKNLTRVTLPNSLKEINGYVFKNCSSLTEITLPSGLTKIGDSAFYGTGLKRLTVPANVKYVGWYAFSRCASLTEIEFLGSAPEFPGKAFNMVTATVYYPSGNSSWNNVAWDKLGGTITHKAK